MHPVVIYFKDGVLHHISLCIISDDLEHDTCFVHELLRIVMLYIKENLPQIKSVDYFIDGCAGQLKNYKAFLNLCHQKPDFDIDAIWEFFATSHGKSPCNGIGGKCKILRASLQRPVNNQILTFCAVKEYCKSYIEGIAFLTIDKEDMVAVRENLRPWYELGDTIPGTRSCHHFVPTSKYTIEGKQLSIDTTVFITHSFLGMLAPQNKNLESLKCNDYITCCFDGLWWLALIEVVNKEKRPHMQVSPYTWAIRPISLASW